MSDQVRTDKIMLVICLAYLAIAVGHYPFRLASDIASRQPISHRLPCLAYGKASKATKPRGAKGDPNQQPIINSYS